MKRPDVQLAWREKVTLCWLIFILNGLIIFYIIEFGKLLCPGFDKAWESNEVAQHQGTNDFWVSVQGSVYDVSNFVWGDHSDVPNLPSNGADSLDLLAGQDMTGYFPPPLALACPGLVSDWNLELTPKNFTAVAPLAMHKSGPDASNGSPALRNNEWYTQTFLPTMKSFRKGPLVWDWKTIGGLAQDQTVQKCVFFFFSWGVSLLLINIIYIQDMGSLGKWVI
jgi:chitin synthase